MSLLSAMPVQTKCDMRLPPGQGDKLLIRLSARNCGLHRTAGRVKRAMQFGTKSAKLNPGKGQDKITERGGRTPFSMQTPGQST